MPYITQERRELLLGNILLDDLCAGDMNYLFTAIVDRYMGIKENYQRYNDCIGALEGAKMELYRRKVAPYEDTKIEQNGDVYT